MSRAPDAGERVKLWRTKEERETLENHAGAHNPSHPPCLRLDPFRDASFGRLMRNSGQALSAQRRSRVGRKRPDPMQEHRIRPSLHKAMHWSGQRSSTSLCLAVFRTHRSETNPMCADLFAILKTTEKLERAWTQDAISAADYELACTKLIAQFKTLWGTLRDTVRLPVRRCPSAPVAVAMNNLRLSTPEPSICRLRECGAQL